MNKMSERKKNVTLHLPVKLMREVRRIAAQSNRPISWQVAEMLERDIDRMKTEKQETK